MVRTRTPWTSAVLLTLLPLAIAQAGEPTAGVKELKGHHGAVHILRFSADGKYLFSGGADGIIRMTEIATGTEVRKIDAHVTKSEPDDKPSFARPPTGVLALVITDDGATLISGGADKCLKAWNLKTGTNKQLVEGLYVTCLAISPDGHTLAATGFKSEIRLIDLATGKEVRKINGKAERVTAAVFSADGKTLFTGGVTANVTFPNSPVIESDDIRTWDVASGKEGPTLGGKAHRLTLSGDGKTILASGHVMRVRKGPPFQGAIRCGDWSIDAENVTQLFDCASLRKIRTYHGRELEVVRSSDGRFLAIAPGSENFLEVGIKGGNDITHQRARTKVAVLDSGSGQLVYQVPVEGASTVAFSPDGKKLAAGTDDGKVKLCDLAATESKFLQPLTREELWTNLAGTPAEVCYRSMWALSSGGLPTVQFLEKKLFSAPEPDARTIRKYIKDLDDEEFAVREAASQALRGIGSPAYRFMKEALEAKPSAEVAKRLAAIMQKLDQDKDRPAPEIRRRLRAIKILEDINTEETRAVLRRVSKESNSLLGEAAKEALSRLTAHNGLPSRVEDGNGNRATGNRIVTRGEHP